MKHLMLVVTLSLGLLAGAPAQPVYQALNLNKSGSFPYFTPRSLNNRTEIAGELNLGGGREMSVVWRNGQYRFLQDAFRVLAVNDHGVSCGTALFKRRRNNEVARWNSKGNIVRLGISPGSEGSSIGYYINNRSWISAGYRDRLTGYGRAAVFTDHGTFEIPLVRGDRSATGPINDNGWVVGQESNREGGQVWGWLWTPENGVRELNILPWDVNEQNVICGRGADQGRGVAAIWRDGVVTRIGDGWAYAINNRNEVVGEGWGGGVFLWTGGVYYNLYELIRMEDRLNIRNVSTSVCDINDRGEIIVSAQDWEWRSNYYLLTPIGSSPDKRP